MSSKNRFPLLPYLDPQWNPDHPLNHIPPIREDPYLPLSAREKRRIREAQEEEAMKDYEPSHVLRSYEADDYRKAQHDKLISMVLHPKALVDLDDIRFRNPNDSSLSKRVSKSLYDPERDKDNTDFRQFLTKRLHLGYNRFHATHGEPYFPSEEQVVPIAPEDICWIMEYTEGECNRVRRKIALLMGLFPAAVDEDSPLYVEEIAWRYERRLYARCRRRNKRCIRPGHIEIFTSSFDVLP